MYRELRLSGALKARLIAPSSKGEQGQALILIGLAIVLAAGLDPMIDLSTQIGGESASANLKKVEQYRGQGPQRLVGKYILSLPNIGEFEVKSRKIHKTKSSVPQTVKVAWSLGEPQNARVLGDYSNRFWPIISGGFLCGLGGFLMQKSKRERAKSEAETTQ